MAHLIKSMRSFLIASLNDFANHSSLDGLATRENLTFLIATLAHYQEEGAKLVPELYLCARIEKLVRAIPNNQVIFLGQNSDVTTALNLALKKGAPLAFDGWCIFVDVIEEKFRFGVFRGAMNPLALNIENSVLGAPDSDCPVVRVMQVAPGCIEVRSSTGAAHAILMNHRSDESLMPNAHFDELVKSICRLVPEHIRNSLHSYFANVLGRGLQEAHGALVVVTEKEKMPKFLNDGISLDPPIRFLDLVLAARADNDARHAEQQLLANSALIRGMLRSDGIIVLSPKGTLLGYNCFVKPSNASIGASGGARTRAYDMLVTKLGKGLSAVFSRSQDGITKFAKD